MMHFSPPRKFIAAFLGTLLAVLGLPSAILTILGTHFSIPVTWSLVAAGVALALVINRGKLRPVHLPVESILPGPIEQHSTKAVHCPCDIHLTDDVAKLARECYGSETIGRHQYEALRVKNPKILACLTSSGGAFLGYFDVIPLAGSFAEMFIEGKVGERDITHEHVLNSDAMASSRYVYLSGIAAQSPRSAAGKLNASVLVWAMLKYLDHYYSFARPLVFASAVTREGERLLQHFGFGLASAGAGRLDNRPMYQLPLSHEQIALRLACLPDYGHLCALPWAPLNGPRSVFTNSRRGVPAQKKLRSLPLNVHGIRQIS